LKIILYNIWYKHESVKISEPKLCCWTVRTQISCKIWQSWFIFRNCILLFKLCSLCYNGISSNSTIMINDIAVLPSYHLSSRAFEGDSPVISISPTPLQVDTDDPSLLRHFSFRAA